MEIHSKSDQRGILGWLKRKLASQKGTLLALTIPAILAFGFCCLVYGAYLNNTGQTAVLKMFLIRVSELNFSFIPKLAKSTTVDIEQLVIDIKFKNSEKIRYLRERALVKGRIYAEEQTEVPAKIRYNGRTFRVDISLTGGNNSHTRHPYKWSLLIKIKDGETIMGMKKFALLYPEARGYLTDWIATRILQSQNVVGLRSDFVNIVINGKNQGLYYLEERFDKRLIENNRQREGIIFKVFQNKLDVYSLKKIKESPELASQLAKLRQLWYGFLNGDIEANELLDLNKFASMFAVSDLINSKHAVNPMNMRLYFNPVTGLVEPIGREWGYLRDETYRETSLFIEQPNPEVDGHVFLSEDPVLKKIIDSFKFEEEYIKQAEIISKPEFLDSILESNQQQLAQFQNKIYQHNPFYEFPLDLLRKNQQYIRSKLHPQVPSLVASFKQVHQDTVSIYVENKLDLPIEVHGFVYNGKHRIVPRNRLLLASKYKSVKLRHEISFQLNDQIDQTGFSADSVDVLYSILGINDIRSTIVYPKLMTAADFDDLIPTQRKSSFDQFSSIVFDPENKLIKLSEPINRIDKDLIIPKGYTLTADPGCTIDLINSSRIISYSPISLVGKPDNEITVTSSDSTGQGIVVYSATTASELSYVNFEHLSNITDGSWVLRGAITFFESPVTLDHCTFRNNLRGDDYLNIIRTNFNLQNTTFENTIADAFDSDFSRGSLKNIKFLNIGNDALDISGTNLEISQIEILNPGDKGLSVGENSYLVCQGINISGGEIAVTH